MSEQGWETVKSKGKQRHNQRSGRGGRGGGGRGGNRGGGGNETDPSVLFPEFKPVPPPTDGTLVEQQQSMLLLVGLPGSGKSTFSRLVEKCLPWKYARVNQDELESRQKCIARATSVLDQGLSPIVDRCNFDVKQRSHFLDLVYNTTIPVDYIVFDIDPNTCLSRCRNRRGHPTLDGNKAGYVINLMTKDWRAPTMQEGFRNISVVHNNATFRQVLTQFIPVAEEEGEEQLEKEESAQYEKEEVKEASAQDEKEESVENGIQNESSSSK